MGKLVSRRTHYPEITGSSPVAATNKRHAVKRVAFFFVGGLK